MKSLLLFFSIILLCACEANGGNISSISEDKDDVSGIVNILPIPQEHLVGSPIIQCEFDSFIQVEPKKTQDGKTEVSYKVITQEKPLHMKFVIDGDGDGAKLIGNNGESDLIISKYDDNSAVFIERNGAGYLFSYNIFSGLSTFSPQLLHVVF